MNVFALVTPGIRTHLYVSLVKGFGEQAADRQIMVCETGNDVQAQGNTILQLIHSNVAGVAMVPVTDPTPAYQVEMLRSHNIPLVLCHRRTTGIKAPLVQWPWEELGRMAGQRLLDAGHQRIGFIGCGRRQMFDDYESGLRKVLAKHGVDLPGQRCCRSDTVVAPPAEDEAHQRLIEMLQSSEDRPTAVFCSDDVASERVYLEAIQLGLQIPQDLSIVGFGSAWREGAMQQRLTAVTVDEVELGRRAALLLDEMCSGKRAIDDDQQIFMPLGFADGKSLGPPSDKRSKRHGEDRHKGQVIENV